MKLYIIRHAWAEERDAERWADDDLRPLTSKGGKRFARVAKRLAKIGLSPARIATSPLVRCRQTAEVLVKQLPYHAELVESEALRPASNLEALLAWSNEGETEELAWVGHAPDVSDLTAALIGANAAGIPFAKGEVAAIEFEGKIQPGAGVLTWLATAKLLDC